MKRWVCVGLMAALLLSTTTGQADIGHSNACSYPRVSPLFHEQALLVAGVCYLTPFLLKSAIHYREFGELLACFIVVMSIPLLTKTDQESESWEERTRHATYLLSRERDSEHEHHGIRKDSTWIYVGQLLIDFKQDPVRMQAEVSRESQEALSASLVNAMRLKGDPGHSSAEIYKQYFHDDPPKRMSHKSMMGRMLLDHLVCVREMNNAYIDHLNTFSIYVIYSPCPEASDNVDDKPQVPLHANHQN